MKRFFYFIVTAIVSSSLLLTTSCHKDDAGKQVALKALLDEANLMKKLDHWIII